MVSITRRFVASLAALGLCLIAAPSAADQMTLLSIQSGHSTVIKADGLTRVAIGDGRIAGVVPVGTSQVIVNAKAPGHTTLYIWAGGRRQAYEVTVTEQGMDDVAQMLRSAIAEPNVQVVSSGHNIVVRGTVSDGAQFQQITDIISRFGGYLVSENGADAKAVIINAVTIQQNLGQLQRAIANIAGASDIRVDPDGKGNVIVSGNATDAVTAQAILDRARGLAGPYLASNGTPGRPGREDRGRARRPHLPAAQARRREGQGRRAAERDLEGARAHQQGRLEARNKAGEARDDQEGEGARRRTVDLQAHAAAAPCQHLLDGVCPLHRLSRGGQVLGDHRDQPVHVPADRALGDEGAQGLADDRHRRSSGVTWL